MAKQQAVKKSAATKGKGTGRKGIDEATKKLAYLLYVEQGDDLSSIATTLGVSKNTLTAWNQAENWKQQRTVRRNSPDKLLMRYYEQIDRILDAADADERPLSSAESDAVSKLTNNITKLDKRADSAVVMQVLKNFNSYLSTNDGLELAKQLTPFQLAYVKELINVGN